MIGDLEAFKALTGMNVTYDIFPEDVYFDKVTAALSSKSDQYDAFMTGAYMTWTYGPAGWIEDLNTYIKDPAKTNPAFAWDDVLPGLRASTAWDGVAGSELGSGKAKQWCIPWGYELNNITYNRTIFDKVGVKPPQNLTRCSTLRPRSPRMPAVPMASAFAARAHGRPSIRASCRPIRTSARRIS